MYVYIRTGVENYRFWDFVRIYIYTYESTEGLICELNVGSLLSWRWNPSQTWACWLSLPFILNPYTTYYTLDGNRQMLQIHVNVPVSCNASCFSRKALSHVTPLRDYFLRDENYRSIKRPPGDQMFLLVKRFGELLRKLWNPRNFKAHVSPHEMLQAVVLLSKKRFQITKQGLCQVLNPLQLVRFQFARGIYPVRAQ